MGLSNRMRDAIMDPSQQQQHKSWLAAPVPPTQWEPDHEPPMDDGDSPASAQYVAPQSQSQSQSLPFPPMTSPLAPLNCHNQVTRFLTKQTLGFIPKLSVRSPESETGATATSPPGVGVYGGNLSFSESPRGPGLGASGSIRLPSLSSTPPLSPHKWSSASPAFVALDEQQPLAFPATTGIYQRGGSFTEGSSSPIPSLKRALYASPAESASTPRSSLTNMSIADLCLPYPYERSQSCPSDAMPVGAAAESSSTQEASSQASREHTWQSAMKRKTYVRAQSCHSDADLQGTSVQVAVGPSEPGLAPFASFVQRNPLQRSSSLDAPTALAMLGHKRSAAESIDLHQWLDRSDKAAKDRSSLRSLAESADSMRQLEQAGRSMCLSDSPRSQSSSQSHGYTSQQTGVHEPKREKKLCNFPECSSNAVTRGLCISHGGGRRCQRRDCTRGAQSKGLCVAHGGGRICRAAGCSNIQRSMGLCIRHGGGRRCRVKGCQKGVVRQDLCTAHGGKRKCRVEDCMKHVKKKGLCRSHANSLYTSGSS